jgi:hypothetical protein
MVANPPAPAAPGEICAACGRTIGMLEQPFVWDESIVCFGCHRDLDHAAATKPAADGSLAERCFFADEHVQITRGHAVFDGVTHTMAEVRFARVQKFCPRRVYAVATALVGVGLGVVGLNRQMDRLDIAFLILGTALLGIGVGCAIARRPTYRILMAANDVESVVFSSHSHTYTRQLVDAIGEAIVERGQFDVPPNPPPTISRSAKLWPTGRA